MNSTPLSRLLEMSAEIEGKAAIKDWKLCHHLQNAEKDKSCSCGAPGTIWGGDQEHVVCEMGVSDPEGLGMCPPRYSRDVEISNAHFIVHARNSIKQKDAMIKIMYEVLTDIGNNYLKCSQNPHNNPVVEWKYLDKLKTALTCCNQIADEILKGMKE